MRRSRGGLLLDGQIRLRRKFGNRREVRAAKGVARHRDQDPEHGASAVRLGEGQDARVRRDVECRMDDDMGQDGGRAGRFLRAIYRSDDAARTREAAGEGEAAGGDDSAGGSGGRLHAGGGFRRGDLRLPEAARREGRGQGQGHLRRERSGTEGLQSCEHEGGRAGRLGDAGPFRDG